jgi:hypothetical protein
MTGPLWAWELVASCRFEAQGLPFNSFCLLSALRQKRYTELRRCCTFCTQRVC